MDAMDYALMVALAVIFAGVIVGIISLGRRK